MPRKKQSPTPSPSDSNSDDAAVAVDEVESDLAAAEGEARDVEATSEEEDASAAEEAPKKKRRGRPPGRASLRVVATGEAGAVREAMKDFSGVDVEGEKSEDAEEVASPAEEEEETPAGTFGRLLAKPGYFVSVTRKRPKTFNGLRCPSRLPDAIYICPTSLGDIKEDVFARFGGETFHASIHREGPGGDAKTLDAIEIRNPDAVIPLHEGVPIGAPEVHGDEEPMIPMEEEVDDPSAQLARTVKEQIKAADQLAKLRHAKQVMKALKEDDDGEAPRKGQEASKVRELEQRIAEMAATNQRERRFEKLESLVTQLAEGGVRGKGGDDSMMKLMITMMQSSDQRFQAMMSTFMPLISGQGKRHDDLDAQLERLSKLRSVFGEGSSRLKSIEEKLMTKALDRLLDGADERDSADQSLGEIAIKEAAPIVRNIVDKMGKDKVPTTAPTQEEFKRAVAQEAQRMVGELAKKWQSEGYLVKLPQGALPSPAPAEPAPAKVEKVEAEEEEENVPTAPHEAGYDRKQAVNFVLDSILKEMPARLENGYLLGDIIDRLDDELLEGLCKVGSAEDLERLIGPHSDQAKLRKVTDAVKADGAAATWLRQMIMSAQHEYQKSLQKRGGDEPAPPQNPTEEF